GADVVGLNCFRGPSTMLPLIEQVRASVKYHVAALPVPYRTTPAEPTFLALTDTGCSVILDGRPFPVALDPFPVQPLRDRRVWDDGLRARRALPRCVLRRGPSPHPEPRGSARSPPCREPLLSRHVEAHRLRDRR